MDALKGSRRHLSNGVAFFFASWKSVVLLDRVNSGDSIPIIDLWQAFYLAA